MHDSMMVHYDIKPDNVLKKKEEDSYIFADFGVSEKVDVLKNAI